MMNDKIAYTDEMLATIFRRPLTTVRLALKTFEQFGMIEIINNTITIPNWEKHQSLDKLEQAKEKSRQRVAAHRERQKLLISGNENSNVTVTLRNAVDKDKDKKEIIYKEKDNKKKTAPRFSAPTLEEVKAYCLERKNNVDAERFIDYYTSNGWCVGKNKMKDWKAAVRTWEKNGIGDTNPKKKQAAPKGISSFETDELFDRAIERSYRNAPTAAEDEGIKKRMEALKERIQGS